MENCRRRTKLMLRALYGLLGNETASVEFTSAPYNIVDFVADPADSSAEIRVNPNGTVESRTGGGAWGKSGDWYIGGNGGPKVPDDPSLWEIIATTQTGSNTDTGTIGTAENLSSARSWGITQTVIGTKTWDGSWTIRLAGGGADQDTTDVDLFAQVL